MFTLVAPGKTLIQSAVAASSPGRRLRKISMSITTVVPAIFWKAPLGRRKAASRSDVLAISARILDDFLSIVPVLVKPMTMPPGLTVSSAFKKK